MPKPSTALKALVFLFCFLQVLPSAAADLKYMKVVQVQGKAKSKVVGDGWRPLTEGFVRNGEVISVDSDSGVNIALDEKFNSILKVSEDSKVSALNPPKKIYVEKGDLFVLREEDIDRDRDGRRSDMLDILTKDGLVQVGTGGFVVSVEPQATIICAFGEEVVVFPFARAGETPQRIMLEEGMKIKIQKNGPTAQKRMTFEDYGPWQTWVRDVYEQKDDLARSVLWPDHR